MSALEWSAPLYLLLVPAILAAGYLWARGDARQESRLAGLLGGGRSRAVLATARPRMGAGRRTPLLAAMVFGAVAAAGPRAGEPEPPDEPGGHGVVILIDVSRSMLAGDAGGSRLDRAKAAVADFLDALRGEPAGIVAFAGSARMVAPLTTDRTALKQLVEDLDDLSVEVPGTDFARALEAGIALCEGARGPCSLVLLTDGEDHGEEAALQAGRALRLGHPVHGVGFGTEAGAKIPAGDGYLRDAAGREVVSRFHPASLRAVTAAAGGELVLARDHASPLRHLYDQGLFAGTGLRTAGAGVPRRPERAEWPLALMLAFGGWAIAHRGGRTGG